MSGGAKQFDFTSAQGLSRSERIEAAQERAAIMEFDGGLSREIADELAAAAWGVTVADLKTKAPGSQPGA